MKVIVATSAPPFVNGGAALIVDWLAEIIAAEGHEVELLKFPLSPNHSEMLDQILALRLIDLSDRGDRLITVRTPSHLLRHPCKVLWFIHHYRSAYDLWGTRYQGIPNTPEGLCYRDAIRSADAVGFREATKVFCNSRVVADRLEKFNRVKAEVLYPPLFRPDRYRTDCFGDFILYVSRLTHHKRQWLALEGLRHTKTPVRLMIVGEPDPDSADYAKELVDLAHSAEFRDRVSIVTRWISEEEKISLLASCLAVAYLPFDEDSYGYPSLEAHHSGKAVVTTSDAGGTQELIVDGRNGFVVPPDPEAIGRVMDALYLDRELARRMGEAGRERIAELGISRQTVIEKLLA
jgi:glycosyltransferase involved in cell wall biosynthesis